MGSEPPLILGFDTSAARCAAALVSGDRVLAARDEAMDRGQAERLLPMLEALLAEAGVRWADLDGLAVCTGPGNFTGLRIAVAAARGLALALGVPAVGVTAFEALAEPEGPSTVAILDRRGTVFVQAFRDGVPLGDRGSRGRARRRCPRPRCASTARCSPASRPAAWAWRRRRRRSISGPRTRCRRPRRRRASSMTPEALAALHALAFADTPRPWSAAEFAALLAEAPTCWRRSRTASRSGGSPDPRPSC